MALARHSLCAPDPPVFLSSLFSSDSMGHVQWHISHRGRCCHFPYEGSGMSIWYLFCWNSQSISKHLFPLRAYASIFELVLLPN